MSTNQNEPVVQPEENSVPTEKTEVLTKAKINEGY